jgi:hypothetical protein
MRQLNYVCKPSKLSAMHSAIKWGSPSADHSRRGVGLSMLATPLAIGLASWPRKSSASSYAATSWNCFSQSAAHGAGTGDAPCNSYYPDQLETGGVM